MEKAPGAMLEILLSYSDRRRTELRPVNVLLSMQLIWLLRSILEAHVPQIDMFTEGNLLNLNMKRTVEDGKRT